MSNFISQILSWPIIVQGALGSALFWLCLLIGNKIVRASIRHSITFGSERKMRILKMERLRYTGALAPGIEPTTLSTVALLYSAAGYAFKAMASIVLGLLLGDLLPLFRPIGYMFALYYLFWAIASVRDLHSDDEAQLKSRLEELEKKIKILENGA